MGLCDSGSGEAPRARLCSVRSDARKRASKLAEPSPSLSLLPLPIPAGARGSLVVGDHSASSRKVARHQKRKGVECPGRGERGE